MTPSVVRTFNVTCRSCPHQVEGEMLDGRVFYFRARHNHWTIGIGATPADAVEASCRCSTAAAEGDDPRGRITYGDAPDEARAIIEACLAVVCEASTKAVA